MISHFAISSKTIWVDDVKRQLLVDEAGGFVSFEGWVRNHNEGKAVSGLSYEVYENLAVKEGQKIVEEAKVRFEILDAVVIHRSGDLGIGEMAVWIGVTAHHRDAAFVACRYLIDEVKKRVPIWKRESYLDGSGQWVACHHV
jgi:molybdopterin synthase catalytic subunit